MIGDIASVATSIGVLIAIYQLHLSRQQARAVFEQAFVDRFWAIEDDRLHNSESADVNRRRYLRLCEDRYEHARLGQISKQTWKIWHEGIQPGVKGDVAHAGEWSRKCAAMSAHAGPDCPAVQR